jgi:hypothetical protein
MNNWIPITERLPEEGVEVLLIDKEGYQSVGYYEKGYIRDNGEYVLYNNPWHTGAGVRTYSEDYVWIEPIAWQPLPEPYKHK